MLYLIIDIIVKLHKGDSGKAVRIKLSKKGSKALGKASDKP